MKHIFVVNPAAGKGKHIPTLLASITYACEDLNVEYDIYHTHAVGDATVYVSENGREVLGEPIVYAANNTKDATLRALAGACRQSRNAKAGSNQSNENEKHRQFSDILLHHETSKSGVLPPNICIQ